MLLLRCIISQVVYNNLTRAMRSFSSAARLASASLRALSSAAAWVRSSRVRIQHARIQGYLYVLNSMMQFTRSLFLSLVVNVIKQEHNSKCSTSYICRYLSHSSKWHWHIIQHHIEYPLTALTFSFAMRVCSSITFFSRACLSPMYAWEPCDVVWSQWIMWCSLTRYFCLT